MQTQHSGLGTGALKMWGHLHYGMCSACAWVGLGWVQAAAFTAVI